MYVFASGNIRWRATGFRSPLDKIKRVSNTRLVYTWIFPGNPPPFPPPLSFLSLFLSLFYSSVSLPDINVLDKYEFIAALAWNVYSRREEEIFFSLRPPISSHRGWTNEDTDRNQEAVS